MMTSSDNNKKGNSKTRNKYYRDRADNVKDKVSMHEVLELYNIPVRTRKREVQFPCPLHGDGNDRGFSARIYPPKPEEDKPYWDTYCFGCQTDRDIIQWVMDKEQVSFTDSIKILEKTFDVQGIPNIYDYFDPEKMVGSGGTASNPDQTSALEDILSQGFEKKSVSAFDFMEKKMRDLVQHHHKDMPMKSAVSFFYALDKLRFDIKNDRIEEENAKRLTTKISRKLRELDNRYDQ